MTTAKKVVKDICDEMYKKDTQQILIDFVQDEVEEALNKEEQVTRDEVGALSYEAGLLLEVYNPVFTEDVDILKRLKPALSNWSDDIERTNIILGIPRED